MSSNRAHRSHPKFENPTPQNAPQLQARPFSSEASSPTSASHEELLSQSAASESRASFSFGNVHVFANETNPTPRSSEGPIQAKLKIGQPGDKYEQEADQVAARVVQQINSPQAAQREDENIQRSLSVPSPVMRLPIQRQNSIPLGTASDEFERSLNSARSGGSSLEPKVRNQMESAIGADFRSVRIHTDIRADQLNRSVQAKAFTRGQDVFFRQGAYQPGSQGGQELIAHELTHVVQQNGGNLQRLPDPKNPVFKTISQHCNNPVVQPMLRRGVPFSGKVVGGGLRSGAGGGGKPPGRPFQLPKAHAEDFYIQIAELDKKNRQKWIKMNGAMLAFKTLEDRLPEVARTYSQKMRPTLQMAVINELERDPEVIEVGDLYDWYIRIHPRAFAENGACTLALKYPFSSLRILLAPIGHDTFTLINIRRFLEEFSRAALRGEQGDPHVETVRDAIKQIEENPVIESVEHPEETTDESTKK